MTSYATRRGPWIATFTGRRFYVQHPSAEDVNLDDIAHALSLTNRFGGHTAWPYSVAQHCLNVATLVETPLEKLHALLHDAAEAYVGDMTRPLKELLPNYRAIEDRIQGAILDAFGLGHDRELRHRPNSVIRADTAILGAEAKAAMGVTDAELDSWLLPEPMPTLEIFPAPADMVESEYRRSVAELVIQVTGRRVPALVA